MKDTKDLLIIAVCLLLVLALVVDNARDIKALKDDNAELRELVVKLQSDVPPIAFQAAQSYEFLTLPIIERDGTETTLGVLLADLGVRSAR